MNHGREFDKPAFYRIRVKGNLDQIWSDWFQGLTITEQADDETLLVGPVADQAALHGLLAKIRDLSLPLLQVERVDVEESSPSRKGGGSGCSIDSDTRHQSVESRGGAE